MCSDSAFPGLWKHVIVTQHMWPPLIYWAHFDDVIMQRAMLCRAMACAGITHAGAVEEVADGEQRGQDVAERLVLLQLLHPLLQILQGLGHFLFGEGGRGDNIS